MIEKMFGVVVGDDVYFLSFGVLKFYIFIVELCDFELSFVKCLCVYRVLWVGGVILKEFVVLYL